MGCCCKRKNENNINNNINNFSSMRIGDLWQSYEINIKKDENKNNIKLFYNNEIKNSENKNDIIRIDNNKIYLDIKEKSSQGELLNNAEIENLKKEKNELIKKVSILEKEKEKIKEKLLNLENKNKELVKKLEKEKEKPKYDLIEKKYEEIKQKNYLLLKSNEDLKSQNKELKKKEIQLQKNISDLKSQNKEIVEKYKLFEKDNKKLDEKYLLLKKIPILIGLKNIGATCYMNATLQCLSNTDELTKYFLNKFKYDASDNNKVISNAYYNVIKNLWNRDNNNKSFSPNEFKEKISKENPLFAGIVANDSKDLINFLLERLHNELNNIKKENNHNYMTYEFNSNDVLDEQKILNKFINEFKEKYNSVISNLFYGLLETKSQCQKCNQVKYNFQLYSFIEFPLEKVNQYYLNNEKRNNYSINNDINKNQDIDLYECFEYYNNSELMAGDNQIYCNICNSNSDSLYESILYSTPNYLIIILNRGKGAVYEYNVNFPDQLNLFNFVTFKNGNTLYELYAVISHIGPSSMSGHFIAFCKNRIDKKWYKYNDAFVTLCQGPNEYRSEMAYILFYKFLLNS